MKFVTNRKGVDQIGIVYMASVDGKLSTGFVVQGELTFWNRLRLAWMAMTWRARV